MPPYRILAGDCVARMSMMNQNSVDNIITDPPYEIGFMGNGWDNTGIAYNPATWKAAHRVLKPNGVMLVFGATRTHHRIADAIKRAGFEIVDIVAWTYGTGFPKSHNISKAIDKMGGHIVDSIPKEQIAFVDAYNEALKKKNMTYSDVDRLLGIKSSACYWSRCDARGSMPPRHHWETLSKELELSDDLVKLYEISIAASREVIGTQKVSRILSNGNSYVGGIVKGGIIDITKSATKFAKQWDGWGTALKPAWEPIIIARKKGSQRKANYSQFHYIPKSSKNERNAGLEDKAFQNTHPTVKPINLMKKLIEEFTEKGSIVFDPFTGSGTTGIASVMTGREFIGCELTPEYIPFAKARIEHHLPKEED